MVLIPIAWVGRVQLLPHFHARLGGLAGGTVQGLSERGLAPRAGMRPARGLLSGPVYSGTSTSSPAP